MTAPRTRPPIFPPYQIFDVGGTRVGFVGYNDPLTPIRQSPAFSRGITFTRPEVDLAEYVRLLRREKGCQVVFVLSHMGLAQQLNLANQPCAEGVDYILGADTHERIREPLQGKFCKVTEPGAFASFVGKLDLVVETGEIKEQTYALLDVDPERYGEDEEMKTLVAAAREPYRQEITKVIGKTRTPLLRYYVIETPMDNLITDALMWKFNTDFVVSNGFRFCPPLVPPEGGEVDITNEYLWSMLPVESAIKTGVVSGQQIVDWLESELENTFAKDATRRFGGWFVRYKGLFVKFTIGNPTGQRLREVTVQGQPLVGTTRYTVLGCEREGDPDDTVCRIVGVANPRRLDFTVHQVVTDYLANTPRSRPRSKAAPLPPMHPRTCFRRWRERATGSGNRVGPLMNRILVIGGTGNVGRHVVDQLTATGARFRAMTRNPDAAALAATGRRRARGSHGSRDPGSLPARY